MTTYSSVTVSGPMQDGFTLPADTVAISYMPGKTQLVFPQEDGSVASVLTTAAVNHLASNAVTVVKVSDVAVRLVAPTAPLANDLLLLVNAVDCGIYQWAGSQWVYLGKVAWVRLNSAGIGVKASSGYKTNLPFTGLTATVKKVDHIPIDLMPYAVYAEGSTGIVYFPYVSANTYQYPYTVVSLYSPALVASLEAEQLVVISPCGYGQLDSLPVNTDYTYITYSSLINPSLYQPVSVYRGDKVLLHALTMMPVSKTIDYTMITGLSEVDYQLTSGYYRGGNNLWDTVITNHGTVNSNHLQQITPTSTYAVALANLDIAQAGTIGSGISMWVYIAKPETVSADDIVFKLPLRYTTSRSLKNLRLAAGEAIFVKPTRAIQYAYRYSILARSF